MQLCSGPSSDKLQPKCSSSQRSREDRRGEKGSQEDPSHSLPVLSLLSRLSPAEEPLAGHWELTAEPAALFLALPTLGSRELQPGPGEAEGRHSHPGTEEDRQCGASCSLVRDRAPR